MIAQRKHEDELVSTASIEQRAIREFAQGQEKKLPGKAKASSVKEVRTVSHPAILPLFQSQSRLLKKVNTGSKLMANMQDTLSRVEHYHKVETETLKMQIDVLSEKLNILQKQMQIKERQLEMEIEKKTNWKAILKSILGM